MNDLENTEVIQTQMKLRWDKRSKWVNLTAFQGAAQGEVNIVHMPWDKRKIEHIL